MKTELQLALEKLAKVKAENEKLAKTALPTFKSFINTVSNLVAASKLNTDGPFNPNKLRRSSRIRSIIIKGN